MATAKPAETCEECGRTIAGKMIACVFEGRIVCLPCDTVARANRRREQKEHERAVKEQAKLAARDASRREAVAAALDRLRRPREFYSKIAGVSHTNSDGTRRQDLISRCQVGQPLALVREHGNPHSRTAIAICNARGQQLGYMVDETSIDVAEAMDAGVVAWARVTNLTGGFADAPTRGVNIQVLIGYQIATEIAWAHRPA